MAAAIVVIARSEATKQSGGMRDPIAAAPSGPRNDPWADPYAAPQNLSSSRTSGDSLSFSNARSRI